MEDELESLKERVRAFDASASERLRSARMESESSLAARAELEDQVRRLTRQLETATTTARTLQIEADRTSSTLADAQTRARQRSSELEASLAEAASELRAAVADRDDMSRDYAVMKSKLGVSAEDVARLTVEVRRLEEETRGVGAKDRSLANSHAKHTATLQESVRKLEDQLSQNKSLVQVLQEQRKHLQQDNMKLRDELDEYLRENLDRSAMAVGMSSLSVSDSFQQ